MPKKSSGIVEIITPVLIVFAIFAVGSYFFLSGRENQEEKLIVTNIRKVLTPVTSTPTPTLFPFQDMTIPYMRNRGYESELGELEKLTEHDNYTSYFTSYDSDGFKINGVLTIPKGPVPRSSGSEVGWPAVVFLHGYIPPQEYETLVNYALYVDHLAKNGLVVFKIDLRGHADSEGEAFGAYYSGDYVVDTLNAYSALKNSDFVDPDKIGLWGHSMSGNIVFRSLAAQPDIPKIVIWSGVVYTYEDFAEFGISDSSYQPPAQASERRKRREELFDTYGDFDPESEFWIQIPATNYLEGIEGAVQVHHAVNDNVVDIDYSRNLMSILDDTEIEHELFEYVSGGHNLTGDTFTQAMQKNVEFFVSE